MERPRWGETDPTEATLPHPKVREGPVNRRRQDAKSACGKAWGAMVMLNAIKPSCASLARRNAPPNPEYWAGPCDETPARWVQAARLAPPWRKKRPDNDDKDRTARTTPPRLQATGTGSQPRDPTRQTSPRVT